MKISTTKLTKASLTLKKSNYFSPNNGWLTNSKINDWLKDKQFFYQKHILGTISPKRTDDMLIGLAVDEWLTKSEKSFDKKYSLVKRRNKDNENELNETQFDKISKICMKVEKQSAYKAIKKAKKQKILTMPLNLGKHFKGIAGIPDFLIVNGQQASIIDLKTAQRAASPQMYHWHCEEYGYYRQMAMYGLLVMYNYPEVEQVSYQHLVVEKDTDGIYSVYTYILADDRVRQEMNNLIDNTLPAIAREKDFKSNIASWEDARVIGSLNYEFISTSNRSDTESTE